MPSPNTLSLSEPNKLRVVERRKTVLVPVADLAGKTAMIYDTYGAQTWIKVSAETHMEPGYVMTVASGEGVVVGESHSILCREAEGARWMRRPITDLANSCFVRLPQKKIYCSEILFPVLEADDNGIYLEPENASDLFALMEQSATCGIRAMRSRSALRIDLEQNRPVCFATKLLTGSFRINCGETMENLASRGIIQTWQLFSDKVIAETIDSGVIFEGNNLFNDLPMAPPRKLATQVPVYTVTLETPDAGVETTWWLG